MLLIKFLGTGGGRTVTVTQLRATGGIYIEMDDTRLYLDPGPGALVHSTREKVPLHRLDAVLLSHAHLDHVNDANAVIEAMTKGALEKRGVLAGSTSAIAGHVSDGKIIDKVVSEYHKKAVSSVMAMRAGEKVKIKDVEITATKTLHTDPTCVGFKLEGKNVSLGYTSDTTYFENVGKQFHGCDVLILNCLFYKNPHKKKGVEFSRHMDSEDAVSILQLAKPKLAIIQHYGMDMLRNNPWKVAEKISEMSGIKTMAVRDFQEVRINGESGEERTLINWS